MPQNRSHFAPHGLSLLSAVALAVSGAAQAFARTDDAALLLAQAQRPQTPRTQTPQSNAPTSRAPAAKGQKGTAGAAQTPAQPARPRIDTVAQQVMLQSPEWKATMAAFDEWLKNQLFYDQQKVAEIKTRLAAGVLRMSAEQLKVFQTQLEEKLDVLYGPLAQEAEAYLAQKFAVATPPISSEFVSAFRTCCR